MAKLRLIALSFVAAIRFLWPGGGFAETAPHLMADQTIQSPVPPIAAIPDQPASSVLGLQPGDLSPWGMFLHADIVVKVVLCGLAFASIVTWTIWLAKSLELALAKRRLWRAYGSLREARSLALAEESLGAGPGVAGALVRAAGEEWRASASALDDRDGLKERVALHLERIEAAMARRMMIGTGILATIGSTAPFVGLFGTVWGIMNSFIGITKMHTTNLAVVAPGIAEALLATAIGLIAAIPAVVIYNHFARQLAGYKALVADAASTVMRLVSRDLSHGAGNDARTPVFHEAAG
jgi:biopolymer transport protein ExbB